MKGFLLCLLLIFPLYAVAELTRYIIHSMLLNYLSMTVGLTEIALTWFCYLGIIPTFLIAWDKAKDDKIIE